LIICGGEDLRGGEDVRGGEDLSIFLEDL